MPLTNEQQDILNHVCKERASNELTLVDSVAGS